MNMLRIANIPVENLTVLSQSKATFAAPRAGYDPATCARDYGVTIPAGFQYGSTIAPGSPATTATVGPPSVGPTSSATTGPTPIPLPSPIFSVLPPPNNSTIHPTGTGTGPVVPFGQPTGTGVVPFTGGANTNHLGSSGGIAALAVGVISLLL
ncbi:MAG: hypothetical protein Q9163_005557 [Psora crenata]